MVPVSSVLLVTFHSGIDHCSSGRPTPGVRDSASTRPRVLAHRVSRKGGILTEKTDPLNRCRTREDFASKVRGLNHAEIIRAAVWREKNILVVGSTGSGKTTLVNAILHGLAQICATRSRHLDRGHDGAAMPSPQLPRSCVPSAT